MSDKDEDRPNKGLEDWEMLQQREEKPLRVPFWLIGVIVALLVGSVLLSFPFFGVREGYERPWFESGLLVGVGYGVVILGVIYYFLRRKNKTEDNEDKDTPKD